MKKTEIEVIGLCFFLEFRIQISEFRFLISLRSNDYS